MVWDQCLERVSARLSGLNFIHYRWRVRRRNVGTEANTVLCKDPGNQQARQGPEMRFKKEAKV